MKNRALKKHLGTVLMAASVSFCSLPTANAAPQVDPIIIEQNREQQQQREVEANKRLNQRPSQKSPQIKINTKALLADGECRVINAVFAYGADLMPQSQRNKIINPILKTCLNNIKITNIANQIQQWYLENGYITTRVTIKSKQNSFREKGNLEIWIIEGKIGAFILGNNHHFDNSRINAAFPQKTGDILRIQDLDQGLEQLNKLFSQQFQMKIKPAARPGYSDIVLLQQYPNTRELVNSSTPVASQQFTATYNNGGTKSTGEDLYNIHYTKENLFGMNDTISFSWQRALPVTENKNDSIRLNASVPYGYWNFKFNYNMGNTVRKIAGNTLSFLSKSAIQTSQISVNRILSRSKQNKIENTVKIEYSERKSYINNTQIKTSSRQIANINYGLTYTQYFQNSTLILSPSLTNGLPLFGAIKNSDNIQKSQPHAEYNLIKLYGYYRQQYLTSSRYSFSTQNAINAQYANQALYGEKQFVLGGEYSIRGFKENVVSNDNGVSLRNDVILPVGLWTLPWHKKNLIAPLTVSLFYDIGEVYAVTGKNRTIMSGWGYSIGYRHKWFTASYAKAKSLRRSEAFTTDEGWVQYLNITVKHSF